MVISKQPQQLRAFLVLQCIVLALGLVYLGDYFRNEQAKGLKDLVFSPKAGGEKKNYICFKVKILSCSVRAKASGNPVERADYPGGCSQGSDKREKMPERVLEKNSWEQGRRNKPNRKPMERI